MKEKQIIIELANCLNVSAVKRKYQITDANLRAILIKAANCLPEEKQPKRAVKLPEFQGKRDFVIFTDGCSRGNPGPAALGVLILDNQGEEILRVGEKLGKKTNNQAEYQALLKALRLAKDLRGEKILIKSDSELMVKQLTGQYKVRNPNILPLYREVKKLSVQFNTFLIVHVPRAENKIADSLANAALDGKLPDVL